MDEKKPIAEKVVLDIMSHFGFRRNYQVAEYFDVTPQTLSGWIKAGEIPPKHMMKYTSEVLNTRTEKSKTAVKKKKSKSSRIYKSQMSTPKKTSKKKISKGAHNKTKRKTRTARRRSS